MRVRPFDRLAVLAGSVLLACAIPASAGAVTLFCSTLAASATLGSVTNSMTDQPCDTSAAVAGAEARSITRPNQLKSYSTSNAVHTNEGFNTIAQTVSQVNDILSVSGLAPEGALLTFDVRLTGNLQVFAEFGGPGDLRAATSYRFAASLANFGIVSGTSRVLTDCAQIVTFGTDTCSGTFVPVDVIVPLSVFARNGDSLELVLGLNTSSFTRVEGSGQTALGIADFSHTVDWLGLHFSPDTAGAVVLGTAGYDYAARVSNGVPEPTTWALMILGFGGAGEALRRRRLALVR